MPVLNEKFERQQAVEELVLSEVNVKELEYLKDPGVIEKSIKANFKTSPKYGKQMKEIATAISQLDQSAISQIEQVGELVLDLQSGNVTITTGMRQLKRHPWLVCGHGGFCYAIALDLTLTEELKNEGLARELVNRIQNIRKDKGLLVTDRISLSVQSAPEISKAVTDNLGYICAETLADELKLVESVAETEAVTVELIDNLQTQINISIFK